MRELGITGTVMICKLAGLQALYGIVPRNACLLFQNEYFDCQLPKERTRTDVWSVCALLQIKRFCIMDPRLSLCVLLLLSLWHGAYGSRILRAGVQGQLPPCKDVPGGIQNWDCYDPPSTPLPPCDFKHHSPGINWNTDGQKPPAPKSKLDISVAGGALTHHGVQGQLPPCKDVPGGIQNWDCYDPPSTPLPPRDFKHQNPGIDCNTDGQKPPSSWRWGMSQALVVHARDPTAGFARPGQVHCRDLS
jgi:hypothetical protein